MMRNIFISLLFLFFIIANVNSSMGSNTISHAPLYPNDSLLNRITNIDQRLKEFTVKDTLGGFSSPRKIETSDYFRSRKIEFEPQRDRQGLLVVPMDYQPFLSYINFIDTIIIDPVMLPIVFEGKLIPKKLDFKTDIHDREFSLTPTLVSRDSIISTDLLQYKLDARPSYKLISKDSTFSNDLWKADRISSIRKQYYINHPQRVKLNALAFGSSPIIKQEVESKNPFKQLITAGDAIELARPDLTKHLVKQVFWRFGAEHSLQFSFQDYSENWTPKTNNNFTLQSQQKFKVEYKKDKVKFDSETEWRLNVQQISIPKEEKEEGKKYHPLQIKEDRLRTENRLGLEAFIKKWSYILKLEITTPVFQKFPINSNKMQAGFASPLDANFGIGMGYNLEKPSSKVKGRKLTLKVDATPFSVAYKLVRSDKVLLNNRHGLNGDKNEDGTYKHKRDMTEIGSTFTINIAYKFNNYTELTSRAKYFTNYEKVNIELETSFNFQLNKYFSTKMYLYNKFDDSQRLITEKKTYGHFSHYADLSFGLNYKW